MQPFHSDHGDMLGERFFRFTKYCLYESSVRVPLMVAGSCVPPDHRGTVDARPAELVDVLPTVLAAAGLDAPPQLVGHSPLGPCPRRGTFCEHQFQFRYPYRRPSDYLWRTPHTKLILGSADPASAAPAACGVELYDLDADPHEWDNVYGEPRCAPLRESLMRELLARLAGAWTRFPQHRGSPGPAPGH